MKTLFLLTFVTHLSMPVLSFSQSLLYNIFLANKQVGSMMVQANKSDSQNFSIHSQTNIAVAFSRAESTLQAQYQDGQLHTASMIQKVNDKVRESSQVTRDGNQYTIKLKDEDTIVLKDEVVYSVALLYHVEPKGKKAVFSERYGVFCPIKSVDADTYEMEMPDGKKVYYTYKNGICTEMHTKQMLMDVRFKLATK